MNTAHRDDPGPGDATRRHWESVYAARAADELSWFQAEPAVSLELIGQAGLAAGDPVIDIGGGASVLAGRLLETGLRDVTVLDISEASLATSRRHLGGRAADVAWIAADVRAFAPRRSYALWHDRALFHFMTGAGDRRAYVQTLRAAVRAGGHVVIAAFAVGGPRRCSGLDIVQYDADRLAAELGAGFRLRAQTRETHVTPAGAGQSFAYFLFRRE